MMMTEQEKLLWASKGFPNANRKCDLPECGKPIGFLTHRGKGEGEFCSNECLVASLGQRGTALGRGSKPPEEEKEEENMPATAAKKRAKKKAADDKGEAVAVEKMAGLYRQGGSKAIYLEMLSDEQPHTIEELSKKAKLDKYPADPIYYLRKDGEERNLWAIAYDRETKSYTLSFKAAGRKALNL